MSEQEITTAITVNAKEIDDVVLLDVLEALGCHPGSWFSSSLWTSAA